MEALLDRLSERRWTLFLLAALAAAIAVLTTQVPARARTILAARDEVRAREALVARVRDPETTARLEAASAALRRSLLRAGSDEEPPRRTTLVLHDVEAAAREADVRIVHLQPGPRVARTAFDEWTLDVDLSGHFHDVGRFLSAAERPPLRARVLALRLEAPDPLREARGLPTLAGTLRLRLVLQPRSSIPTQTPAGRDEE